MRETDMSWKPTNRREIEEILAQQVADLSEDERQAFERFRLEPYQAPITRYGKNEKVFVVARNGDEVMYWEDVEEGFNISPFDRSGQITQHWCNQDSLKFALARWLGRGFFVQLWASRIIR
jgi:hypothetical protein